MNSSAALIPQNPLYLAYRSEPGFHFALFLPAFIYSLVALAGIPLNFSVCYVTMKQRRNYPSLGSNTGILLALNSAFQIVHEFSHFFFFAITVSGTNFIPLRLALFLEGYTIVGFISTLYMVSLSFDRLLAVSIPLIYRRLNHRIYIFVHLFFVLGNGFNSLFGILKAAEMNPQWMVTGFIGDFFAVPGYGQFGFMISLGGLALTIIFYCLIAVMVKLKTEIASDRMQKLYRSLVVIVFINVGGYFVTDLLIVLFLNSLLGGLTIVQFWFLNMGTGFLLNIGAASNAPILYFNSNEYRKAYAKEFKRIRSIFCPNSTRQTIAVIPASQPIRSVGGGSESRK